MCEWDRDRGKEGGWDRGKRLEGKMGIGLIDEIYGLQCDMI